ncbi:hypothetical protein K470DRAFT_276548 [Piedraia hortae CBS 480.64]|uniref:Uncharacterized protein n=1 Tax=Piedraia hortae CBS 480.64 TaxID=1314780 RepID=A0A6A7C218_9PEZI|nr:hypothetical protein K470DRAFT_276548 [Piedraia hortae CBS 480.64]
MFPNILSFSVSASLIANTALGAVVPKDVAPSIFWNKFWNTTTATVSSTSTIEEELKPFTTFHYYALLEQPAVTKVITIHRGHPQEATTTEASTSKTTTTTVIRTITSTVAPEPEVQGIAVNEPYGEHNRPYDDKENNDVELVWPEVIL